MFACNVPLTQIAPTMGHADTRMLEKVYAKLTPEQLRKLMRKSG